MNTIDNSSLTIDRRLDSEAITNGIKVQAFPSFVPEQSDPRTRRYFFSYKIIITNEGDETVKLLSRHWVIINAIGDREDVNGPGVVGYTPELNPGESFEYASFCPIDTNWGTMEGSYTMQKRDGEMFDAEIARFYLVSSEVLVN